MYNANDWALPINIYSFKRCQIMSYIVTYIVACILYVKTHEEPVTKQLTTNYGDL